MSFEKSDTLLELSSIKGDDATAFKKIVNEAQKRLGTQPAAKEQPIAKLDATVVNRQLIGHVTLIIQCLGSVILNGSMILELLMQI